MPVAEKRLTWDDIRDWPEDVSRQTELFDGRLQVSPTPGRDHGFANTELAAALIEQVAKGRRGRLFVAPIDVVLAPDCVCQPDICFVSTARLAIIEPTHIAGPPDLCIEIISESGRKRDEVTKFAAYARYGVAEYWLVDPAARRIRTYRHEQGRYVLLNDAGEGDLVLSRVFPELHLDPANVFPSA
ncbi:MAG: Uma2 family endonuclease [Bryobacterales bacterium]|nr:Uma2 family endonuclease [Acidobacteriota bacterium]MCB9384054.1 Uma2 family endonuclease [Bryobacterales bacterium]